MSTSQAVPHSEILNLSSSENQIGEFFVGAYVGSSLGSELGAWLAKPRL